MQMGRLKDRGTLQRATPVNDGGSLVPTYATVNPSRVPCAVESPTGERVERLFGAQVTPIATHLVYLRKWDAVRLGDRFVWHDGATDRTLEIRGRQQLGGATKLYQVLACEERDVA